MLVCLTRSLGDNSNNSSTRLTLSLVVMVVASLAGDDGGGGLEWNTLLKSGGKFENSKIPKKTFGVSMGLVGSGRSETGPVVTCHFSRL